METRTLVCNLYGGPGIGKSTFSAGVFYKLKLLGYNVELVREFAKELTWTSNWEALKIQPYVTTEQYYRQASLIGKVDVIVTDSPFLLGLIYRGEGCPPSFDPYIVELYKSFDNLNFVLGRNVEVKKYNPKGRTQTLEESVEIDAKVKDLLKKHSIDYEELFVEGDSTTDEIVNRILIRLSERADIN